MSNIIDEDKLDYDITKKTSKEQKPIKEFFDTPPVIFQRDTEGRAKQSKVKKMLSILQATHLEVAICRLTKDCMYHGKLYKKGYSAIVNGNTRKLFWMNGLSDKIPAFVNATIYEVETIEEMRIIYNQYDNPDSMERNQQKVYGILRNVYDFEPTCEKVIKGEVLTGINYACHKLNSKLWNQPGINPNNIQHMLGEYIEELKLYDTICRNRSRWDQALICAALMSLKKYRHDPKKLKKLLTGLTRIDEKSMNTTGSEYDGITFICLEWFTKGSEQKFRSKLTHWSNPGGFSDTVPYALYWIENFMNDKCLKQPGFNWRETADKWFDDIRATNNSLNAILNTEDESLKLVA